MSMTIQVAPLAGGLVTERGPIFVMRGEGPTSYTLYNQNWAILVLSDFAHLGKKYIRLGLTESDSDGVACKVWVWSHTILVMRGQIPLLIDIWLVLVMWLNSQFYPIIAFSG